LDGITGGEQKVKDYNPYAPPATPEPPKEIEVLRDGYVWYLDLKGWMQDFSFVVSLAFPFIIAMILTVLYLIPIK